MTEKQYAPTKTEKKVSQKVEAPKQKDLPKPVATPKQKSDDKKEISRDNKSASGEAASVTGTQKGRAGTSEVSTENKAEQKSKDKKKKKPTKKVKKDFVVVNASGLRISTKYAVAICDFIRWKKIEKAIEGLENVLVMKMHIPMRGEYAHKRGAGKIGSGAGKYPKYATEVFIGLLKSLNANAMNHDVDEPIVAEAIANFGARPLGRFGRWKRKRTNVKLVARGKKDIKKIRNKNSKKLNKKVKEKKK